MATGIDRILGETPAQPSKELTDLANTDPVASGYADDMGKGAPQAAADDLAVLFSGIAPASIIRWTVDSSVFGGSPDTRSRPWRSR